MYMDLRYVTFSVTSMLSTALLRKLSKKAEDVKEEDFSDNLAEHKAYAFCLFICFLQT